MGAARSTFKRLTAMSILIWSPLNLGSQAREPESQYRLARRNEKIVSSQTFRMGGATIQVDFASGNLDVDSTTILRWIQNAAHAVTVFYGRFPVQRARVLIVPVSSEQSSIHGTTWGNVEGFPGLTRMRLGQHVTERDLSEDWTMTHEFVHLAFSSLPDSQHWMEEGLATYVEPIARAQAGQLSPEQVWRGMVLGMPQGEPEPGDRGLDRTRSWGRIYWGGAMFCLVADVTIRRQTHNSKGLQDALRAIVAAGGTIDKEGPLVQVLKIGDRATGTTVLVEMYKNWSGSPSRVDLPSLWAELGVHSNKNRIVFYPDASLARIRDSITTRTPLVSAN
jgi:hypothetical protein